MVDADCSDDDGRLLSYFTALESAGNGLLITDPKLHDNPIIYTNQVMADRCGMKVDEIIGQNCRFLQRGDRNQASISEIRLALRELRPVETTIRNYTKSGRAFQNHLTIVPVLDKREKLKNFVGIQYDIGATQRAEERLLECFAVLSHELRTPVTTIHAALDVIQNGLHGAKSPPIQRILRAATGSCETLTAILDELLRWDIFSIYASRLERRPLELGPVVRDLVDQLSPLVKSKGTDLELRVHPKATVVANPDGLKQILSTLLIHAITSCPPGGKTMLAIETLGDNSTMFRITTDGDAFSHSPSRLEHTTLAEELKVCAQKIKLLGGCHEQFERERLGSSVSFEMNSR